MAGERVVVVTLRAQVSNYLANMEQVRKSNRDTGSEAEQLAKKTQAQSEAMKQIGAGMITIGAIAAVGVALAVKKFAEFDQAMSNVKAATQESATNMAALRDAALDAGARTVFSATEAANAIEELGKAGLSTSDILNGGLDGALDLASAGGLGVAEAAGIAATALKTFKLEGGDMAHVADLLAAGAGKAMGDVTDLSGALAQSGMVAASTGISIEETTGTLAAFAAQGLLGSDAGTSFKSMLQRLTPQSAEAKAKMDELGISAYDAGGNFIGMAKFAGNLQQALKDKTTEERNSALATIFGSDAVRAATVLYSEGEAGIADWNDKVNDSGYAAKVAADRLDNLSGDVEGLGGAFDTALIKSGGAANESLRFLTQTATNLLDLFNGAPQGVQSAALAIGVLTTAVGIGGGAFLIAVPKVVAYRAALELLSPAAKTAGAAIAGVGKVVGVAGLAIAAAAVGFAILDGWFESINASAAETDNSITHAASAIALLAANSKGMDVKWWSEIDTSAAGVKDALESAAHSSTNFFDAMSQTQGQKGILDTIKTTGEGLGRLAATDLPSAQNAFRMLSEQMGLNATEQWRMLENMPDYKQALIEQANALDVDVASTDEAANKTTLLKLAQENATPTALTAADAYLKAADEAAGLDTQIRTLIDSINVANGVGQDAVSTNASYQGALAGISDEVQRQKDEFVKLQEETYKAAHDGSLEGFVGTLDGFTLSLDESTSAGSANADMLAGVAKKAQDAAAAQYELDKTTMGGTEATDKYVATLAASRDALIKTATANGYTTDEVQKLADKVYALPSQKEIQILADTAAAQTTIDSLVQTNSGRVIRVNVLGETTITSGIGNMVARATGGILPGAPSAKDNMLIHAASGEFVTNAASTAKNRAALEYINNGGVIQGFANGGLIGQKQSELASVKASYAHLSGDALKAAKDRAKVLSDQLDDLKKARGDFYSDVRQGKTGSTFSAVDELRAMSGSKTYDGANQKAMSTAAAKAEIALGKLSKQAKSAASAVDKASDKLGDLKDSSKQMADGISSSLRGAVRASDAFGASSKEVWKKQGNLTYSQTAGVSATGVAAFYKSKAAGVAAFAAQLKKLAAKGVNGALLEEIALMGVDEGGQMATALLAASSSQIKSINADYKAIGKSADKAGNTVADVNFEKLITAAEKQLTSAEKSAKGIESKIKIETDRVVSIIKSTLGIPGHSTGGTVTGIGSRTSDSNLRWLSLDEEVISAGPASKHRGLLKAINSDNFGGIMPTYVTAPPRFVMDGNGGKSAPILVQVEFKDAALRQMVQVEVKQQDDRSRVMLEVL